MTSLTNFDVWDQALLTDTIKKPLPGSVGEGVEGDALGNKIAPLVPHAARTAKVRFEEAVAYGKGQVRAPDATPALYKPPGYSYTEEIIELALLDEMERIQEEQWMALNSPDENIARSAGRSIVERGQILKSRNFKLTEWMRWQAFSGELTITYPTGSSLYINYGLPAGHKPTATTLWSNHTSADPLADLETWSEVLSDDSGFRARYAHMTSRTYRHIVENTNVKNMVNFYAGGAPRLNRPTLELIQEQFQVFSPNLEIVLYDDGFRDVGASGFGYTSLTRYLPDGKVLLTTDYVLGGTRIADVLDGQVTVSSGYNSVDIKMGEQAEVMLDHISKTHFLRYASARIPRLLIPEAFLWATVA